VRHRNGHLQLVHSKSDSRKTDNINVETDVTDILDGGNKNN